MSTKSLKNTLLMKVATSLAVIFKYCGITLDEVKAGFEEAYRVAEDPVWPEGDQKSVTPKAVSFLGTILHVWRNDERFVDDVGEPRALTREGREDSLRNLYEVVSEDAPENRDELTFEQAEELLLHHKSIERTEDGRYKKLAIAFRLPAVDTSGSLMQLTYAAEFLETIAHNTYRGQGGRFCLVARSTRFPKDKVGLVNSILNSQGMTFLQNVDEIVEAEKSKRNDGEEQTMVGVGVYLIEREWGWQ